ncbi:mammalian cell entry protein [Nocardia crassostreae]|uniref:mammalian cell entry protein n=1 Tax=Nocardia crassostreae TaxID=53428 RepID=UPI000AD959EF|nr:mammalian cell entry protein [Nocardia crassostreae]
MEDLLTGLSTFVSGGGLQKMQDIVNQANAVLPAQPADTARIFDVIGRDARDVADNLDASDRLLAAIQADLAAVRDNATELDALLSERGATDIPADAQSLVLTLGIVGSLATVGHALEWASPLLVAGDAAAKAFVPMLLGGQPLNLSSPSNLNRLVSLLRDKIIPFAEKGPKVNITSLGVEGDPMPADQQVDRMVATLRMIGLVR